MQLHIYLSPNCRHIASSPFDKRTYLIHLMSWFTTLGNQSNAAWFHIHNTSTTNASDLYIMIFADHNSNGDEVESVSGPTHTYYGSHNTLGWGAASIKNFLSDCPTGWLSKCKQQLSQTLARTPSPPSFPFETRLPELFQCHIKRLQCHIKCVQCHIKSMSRNVTPRPYALRHIPSMSDTAGGGQYPPSGKHNCKSQEEKVLDQILATHSLNWQCGHLLTDTSGWKMVLGWAEVTLVKDRVAFLFPSLSCLCLPTGLLTWAMAFGRNTS